MDVIPFIPPDAAENRPLFSAYLDAIKVSLETGYIIRVVTEKDSDEVAGFALFHGPGLISALSFQDSVEDVWSLFDAMHFYFEMVEDGEA